LPSVGGMGVTSGTAHTAMATALESIVTAPFRARALPDTFAPVVRVMLASARMQGLMPRSRRPIPRANEASG
jgi:hypothetical protein